MQILVLGMHRSGTSAVTRLLNMMGCHLGAPASIMGANPENPRGFWENEDIKALNIEAMTAVGCRWDRVLHLDPAVFSEDRFKSLRNRMTHEIIKLDSCRPWAVKDPRMCLMTPVWRPKLELPIGLLTYRPAIEIAKSLHTRNKMPLAVGLGLWEKYTIESLRNSLDMPRFLVSYPRLVEDPHESAREIFEKLVGLGVRRLELPAPQEIAAFIESDLRRQRATEDLTGQFLNKQQLRLDEAMRTGEALEWSKLPEVSGSAQEVMAWYEGFIEAGIATGDVEIGKEKTIFDPLLNAERIRTLKQRVSARDEELAQVKKQTEAAKKEAEGLVARLASADTSLSVATNEIRRLEASLNEAQKGLQRISELEQHLATRQKGLDDAVAARKRLETELTTARKDVRYLFEVVKRLVHNMENWNRNWWWRTGMRLRVIAGKLMLRRGKPRMPADIAGEVWREVRAKFEPRFAPKPATGATGPGLPTEIRELNSVVLLLEEWLDSILLDLKAIAGLCWFRLGCTVRKASWAAGLRPPHPWDPVEEFENLQRNVEAWRKNKQALLSASKSDARAARGQYAEQIRQLMRWIEVGYRGVERIGNHKWWKLGLRLHRLSRGKMERPLEDAAATIAKYRRWQKTFTLDVPAARRDSLPAATSPVGLSVHWAAPLRRVDVVVCVHNALADTQQCLMSLVRNTPQGTCTLYVVNDGSDTATTQWLRKFAHRGQAILLESPVAQRYTRAANRGLRASTGDYVVLLNSDTIVPEGWLERLLECAESDPAIGIVGPLSNSATYQSVPELRESGDWAANRVPAGYTVDDMAEAVRRASDRVFPRTPFLNGFCYMIKRAVIDKIGYLDEDTFPNGYGEENDYSLRAAAAGFELAIADHVYVYHARSRSYSNETRRQISPESNKSIRAKHGNQVLDDAIARIEGLQGLDGIRARVRQVCDSAAPPPARPRTWKVLFLLLDQAAGSGGANMVVYTAEALNTLGVKCEVAIHSSLQTLNLSLYARQPRDLFYFYDDEEQLLAHAALFDFAVATHFLTVAVLRRACAAARHIVPAYFIQDYEPLFVSEKRPDLRREACESYTAIPDMVRFTYTDWIAHQVKENHGIELDRVRIGLDTRLYHPRYGRSRLGGAVHVVAMVRPETPRRAPRETMEVLRATKAKYPDRVRISIFGSAPDAPAFAALPRDFDFDNLGRLSREQIADLMATADVFLDMSAFQAFGCTGLEAMALGCTPVLPIEGGVHEYARHEENALLVDTQDVNACVAALDRLVTDDALRARLSRNGIATAAALDIRGTATTMMDTLLRRHGESHTTVIVPVFNALDETRECLDSLLLHTQRPHRVLVIDDASTDDGVWPMIEGFAGQFPHVMALSNGENLGYTRTINRGCRMADGDVVLLNSDTRVTPGWLEKLRAAAYSRPEVATVTPLSNAAGAFSVPKVNEVNPIPQGMTVDATAAIVEQRSPRLRPEAPTGNGFCMYITRRTFARIGCFDDANFPRGYGEENDFCIRATLAGMVHLVDDATYIYHKRSASFGATKGAIAEESWKRLVAMYPDYEGAIKQWMKADGLAEFRARLADALASGRPPQPPELPQGSRILYVLHSGAGGTSHTSLDLASRISGNTTCWLLQTGLRQWDLIEIKDGHDAVVRTFHFGSDWLIHEPLKGERLRAMEAVFEQTTPHLLHVRHILGNHAQTIRMGKDKGLPVVVSFHDHYAACPTFHLVDNQGRFCAGHCNTDDNDCACSPSWFVELPPLKNQFVRQWRATVGPLLDLADAYVFTSPATQRVIYDVFPYFAQDKAHIIEHGRDTTHYEECARVPRAGEPVKVAFFGALGMVKGIHLVKEILELNEKQGQPVHLHMLGDFTPVFEPSDYACTYHGAYERDELHHRLKDIAPAIVIMPSICSETYSHTLTEAWACGLPVLGTTLGAVGERIERLGGGWVLPPEDPQAWLDKIREIASSTEDYAARIEEIRRMPARSVDDMTKDYLYLYGRLLNAASNAVVPELSYDTEPVPQSAPLSQPESALPSTSSSQIDLRTPVEALVADITAYDFFDFGPNDGKSVSFAQKYLGGGRPLGFEIDPESVQKLHEKAIDCVPGDLLRLVFPNKVTRFTLMSHFLEHMPGLEGVRAVLHEAVRASRDFLYIQGPFFDADSYLRSYGFKCFYSDWKGHTCNLKSWELLDALRAEGAVECRFFGYGLIRDSLDDTIHPLEAKADQHHYDASKHPPKTHIPFNQPVYKELICCVRLRDIDYFPRILRARQDIIPLNPMAGFK